MDLFNTVRNAILEGVDRKKQTIQREIADLQNKITKAHMGGSGDVKAYQAEIERLRAQLREESEQIDELSGKTLRSYALKATTDRDVAQGNVRYDRRIEPEYRSQAIKDRIKTDLNRIKKRKAGEELADRKLNLKSKVKVHAKEEVEQIAETKKYEFDVSGEYGNKAADRFVNLAKKKGIDAKVHTYNGPGGGNPVVHLAHSDHTVIHKFLKKHYDPHMSHDEIERHRFDEAVKNPYAVGMAAAMKATGDKPPLKKSTIIKGHEIAKGIEAKEEVEDLEEGPRGESPTAGTRLVSKHQGKDGHHAEVRYNPDWQEYQVHHYHNGKHMGEGPVSYHGEGREGKKEATETAEHATKNFHVKNGKLHMNEHNNVDEGFTIRSKGYGTVQVVKGGKVIKTFTNPQDARMHIAKINKMLKKD